MLQMLCATALQGQAACPVKSSQAWRHTPEREQPRLNPDPCRCPDLPPMWLCRPWHSPAQACRRLSQRPKTSALHSTLGLILMRSQASQGAACSFRLASAQVCPVLSWHGLLSSITAF